MGDDEMDEEYFALKKEFGTRWVTENEMETYAKQNQSSIARLLELKYIKKKTKGFFKWKKLVYQVINTTTSAPNKQNQKNVQEFGKRAPLKNQILTEKKMPTNWVGVCPLPPPGDLQVVIKSSVWLPSEYLIGEAEKWEGASFPSKVNDYVNGKLNVIESSNMAMNDEWKKFFMRAARNYDYSKHVEEIRKELEEKNKFLKRHGNPKRETLEWIEV